MNKLLARYITFNKICLTLLLFINPFINNNIHASNKEKVNYAQVRLLNKHTSKSELVELKINESYIFDQFLHVMLRTCYKSSVQDDPENKAFIQIVRVSLDKNYSENFNKLDTRIPSDFPLSIEGTQFPHLIFSGWLFSSSPSINYLQDSVYDITLITCYFKDNDIPQDSLLKDKSKLDKVILDLKSKKDKSDQSALKESLTIKSPF